MDHWRAAFKGQAQSCAELGSPFTAKICELISEHLPTTGLIAERIRNWEGNMSSGGDSVPLRFCGALHALANIGHNLSAHYPSNQTSDKALWSGIETAVETDAQFIDRFLDNAPETNEVRRSVALIAAGQYFASAFKMPWRALELGASAGLNINWSDYAVETEKGRLGAQNAPLTLRPDWRGLLCAQTQMPDVTERLGVDLNPLDPKGDADRLMAYLWADQPERATLTRAAIDAASTKVAKGDAIDWLRTHIQPRQGMLTLVYHTIAWQYFPLHKRNEGRALISQAGAAATLDSPLIWLSMEADTQGPGAALTARIWPQDEAIALARVDFHGRWIEWQAGSSYIPRH